MKETKGHKSVMTLGMNMRYAPEIRPILLQIEVSQESGFKGYMTSHKTLSLTDEKTGAMLQAVITPEVEKVLKEIIGEWKDQKGKIHQEADAPKYKAAGNSIALPFWQWLMFRIYEQLKKDGIENPTMASLFDGIGGFPLTASRANIKPLWASEIEDFPIAVTKERFKENGKEKT